MTIGTDTLTITDQFLITPVFGAQNDIERFEFADTTLWTDKTIREMLLGSAKTSGADTIVAFDTADVIDGGAGNDILQGGSGGDTYLFGLGYGQDTIEETLNAANIVAGPDVVEFGAGISRSDITFSQAGNDLVAAHSNGTDILTIKDHFNTNYVLQSAKVEFFKFADGTVLTAAEAEVNGAGSSSVGSDTITGTTGDDILDGGAGNDTLSGGDGSDTYVFDAGYGADTIDELNTSPAPATTDVVTFSAGISPQDVALSYVGSDLVFTLSATGDTLTVKDQYATPALGFRANAVEEFIFADGTTWTDEQVRAKLLDLQQTAGNDTVRGFFSDDVISAGAGSDTLQGGDGNDTYLFEAGFGPTVIEEIVQDLLADENDTIAFAAGIAPEDVTLSRPSGTDDLLITVAGGDQITVKDQFLPYNFSPSRTDIEQITFANGAVWTQADIQERILSEASTSGIDTIDGFFTADTLDGGTGNDLLRGGDGGDTYIFGTGYGQDVIAEDLEYHAFLQGDPDIVQFASDLTRDDVVFSRAGNDLVVSLTGSADTLTIDNHYVPGSFVYSRIEAFHFADGDVISAAEAEALAILQQSTDGDDNVLGSNDADLIDAGLGNDIVSGGTGGDVYVFGRGYGADSINDNGDLPGVSIDEVRFRTDAAPDDLIIERNGNDIVLTIEGTTDVLTLKDQSPQFAPLNLFLVDRIERFVFVDGTVWSAADLDQRAVSAQASAGADTIVGGYLFDTLDGGAGDDLLKGGTGDDTYIFGLGYDSDTIDDSDYSTNDPDTVIFKSGVASADIEFLRVDDDLVMTIAGTSDMLTVKNQFVGNTTGGSIDRIDSFTFEDESNTVWTAADVLAFASASGGGDEILTGTNGDDYIDGGSGNDEIYGLNGNDTLLGGSGDDLINGRAGADTIDGGPGFDTATFDGAFGVTLDLANPSNNTSHAAGDSYTNVEKFILTVFADTFVGTAGDETVDGLQGADTLIGGAGNDTYIVDNTNDSITELSGEGHDVVYALRTYTLSANVEDLIITGTGTVHGTGNSEDNRIVGNIGANNLTGGGGNDTFVFGASIGLDKILDFGDTSGNEDIIELDAAAFADYAAVQAAMSQVGSDAVITQDINNKITIVGTNVANLDASDFAFV